MPEGSKMDNCDLCNQTVDERSVQEQCDFFLCLSCYNKFDDDELKEQMNMKNSNYKKIKNQTWQQLIDDFKKEFGGTLPDSFFDSSYGNDLCPSVLSEKLHIQIGIDFDFKHFDQTEYEKKHQYRKYTVFFLDHEHNTTDRFLRLNDIEEIKIVLDLLTTIQGYQHHEK